RMRRHRPHPRDPRAECQPPVVREALLRRAVGEIRDHLRATVPLDAPRLTGWHQSGPPAPPRSSAAMRRAAAFIACAAALACAAPANAVVGGTPIAPETVPWFASGSCGAMLVAPDRLLTAGHCVKGNTLGGIAGWVVGGETRNGTQFALHPNWRKSNGE